MQIRPLISSLLIVPILAIWANDGWMIGRDIKPQAVFLQDEAGGLYDRQLRPVVEGADWTIGVTVPLQFALRVGFTKAVGRVRIKLQADCNDVYEVWATDGARSTQLWSAPVGRGPGLVTRISDDILLPWVTEELLIKPSGGDGDYAVSWVEIVREPIQISQWLVVPLLWGVWLMLLSGRRFECRLASAVLNAWERWDPVVAACVLVLCAVRISPSAWLTIGSGAIALAAFLLIRRFPLLLLSVGVFCGLLVLLVPYSLRLAFLPRFKEAHSFNVDHRLIPNAAQGINVDGIRFRGKPSDLAERDFVVLFLGDSFTHGFQLSEADTLPVRFEQLTEQLSCTAPIRSVNAAWPSASPLLALRLLKDKAAPYRPDLVLYFLDMTDFHDDLKYEAALQASGDLEWDYFKMIIQLWNHALPRWAFDHDAVEIARSAIRWGGGSEVEIPKERFFVTNQPLDKSRAFVERGTMRHLREMGKFAEKALGARFTLVLYPRSYQYSARECPQNWEANEYSALGPYVLEPFRYFDEVSPSLSWKVLNLLPAFQSSSEFPLYERGDPHWNREGAALAARETLNLLLEAGLLPCRRDFTSMKQGQSE